MTERHRLALGIYNHAGLGVLNSALNTPGVVDIAVYTHPPTTGLPDIEAAAREVGLWATTEPMQNATPPFEVDLISLVYYQTIVPQKVIDSVDGRIFNCHPSLLPRHRGCSSIPWAIIEGDEVTGVTYHWVEAKVDKGDVMLQAALVIADDETAASLYQRAMQAAVEFWPAAHQLALAEFPGVPQRGEGCFHRRGAPHHGYIDERWSTSEVERFIRAMTFPPLPYARFRGEEVESLDQYLALQDSTMHS